jgi:dephospho-CoA kinase
MWGRDGLTSTNPYTEPRGPRRRRDPVGDGVWVIGVTGGASAGKSHLVALFEESGARVVSADRIGHRVLDEPEVRERLVQVFGSGVLGAGGAVDRRSLGRLVFSDSQSLARLNAISHPRLLAELRDQLAAPAGEGFRGLVVLEAALLVEWDVGGWCDRVVAVTAPYEQRLARVMTQLGRTREDAENLLNRQLSDEVRVRYADHTLINHGSLREFTTRALELVEKLWAEWRAESEAGR